MPTQRENPTPSSTSEDPTLSGTPNSGGTTSSAVPPSGPSSNAVPSSGPRVTTIHDDDDDTLEDVNDVNPADSVPASNVPSSGSDIQSISDASVFASAAGSHSSSPASFQRASPVTHVSMPGLTAPNPTLTPGLGASRKAYPAPFSAQAMMPTRHLFAPPKSVPVSSFPPRGIPSGPSLPVPTYATASAPAPSVPFPSAPSGPVFPSSGGHPSAPLVLRPLAELRAATTNYSDSILLDRYTSRDTDSTSKWIKAVTLGISAKFSLASSDTKDSEQLQSVYDLSMRVNQLATFVKDHGLLEVFLIYPIDPLTGRPHGDPVSLFDEYGTLSFPQVAASMTWMRGGAPLHVAWATDISRQLLENCCDSTLCDKVYERFSTLSLYEQGGATFFKIALELISSMSAQISSAIALKLTRMRIKDYPGEDIGTVVGHIRGAVTRLRMCNMLPPNIDHIVLGILQTASSFKFCQFFAALHSRQEADRLLGGSSTLSTDHLLSLAVSQYTDLLEQGRWLPSPSRGSGFPATADSSCPPCATANSVTSAPSPAPRHQGGGMVMEARVVVRAMVVKVIPVVVLSFVFPLAQASPRSKILVAPHLSGVVCVVVGTKLMLPMSTSGAVLRLIHHPPLVPPTLLQLQHPILRLLPMHPLPLHPISPRLILLALLAMSKLHTRCRIRRMANVMPVSWLLVTTDYYAQPGLAYYLALLACPVSGLCSISGISSNGSSVVFSSVVSSSLMSMFGVHSLVEVKSVVLSRGVFLVLGWYCLLLC